MQSTAPIKTDQQKRNTAYKLRIGDLFQGKPVMNGERFSFLELGDKKLIRVNIVANIIEKYQADGKNFLSFTIDDASGQIRIKSFGDDMKRFTQFSQGDTVMVIGVLRSFNNELYLSPEIIKTKDPRYLLIRKLELTEKSSPLISKDEVLAIKDQIIAMLKESDQQGGADIDALIMNIKSSPETINQEIKKMLEQGLAYEPRPGKLRFLG